MTLLKNDAFKMFYSGIAVLSGAALLRCCYSIRRCTSQVSLFYQMLPCHSFSMQGRQERKNRMPWRHPVLDVARGGLEPSTPRVWTACSSQLSYLAISNRFSLSQKASIRLLCLTSFYSIRLTGTFVNEFFIFYVGLLTSFSFFIGLFLRILYFFW